MKRIRTDDAEGSVLAYDTTIVTKTSSETLFQKGHKIGKKDIPKLKDSGVYYVWVEDGKDGIGEEEISFNVASRIAGESVEIRKERHGMCSLIAESPGIVSLSATVLRNVNEKGIALVISRADGSAVGRGDIVAVVDSIPLSISESSMRKFLNICDRAISVKEFSRKKVGLVVTGTEIYEGRKKDKYRAVIMKKCHRYGWGISFSTVVKDNEKEIAQAVRAALKSGAEGIIITGGMSVDPTDRTPLAVKELGARIISYGIPVKPTTMTMIAELKGIPIFAISAGGIHYSKFNSIDMIFTKMMANELPDKRKIAELGNGGLTDYYLSTIRSMRSAH
ncbi:MAG: molybdopterin-binding protein [Thermoplasmatales archaeon]